MTPSPAPPRPARPPRPAASAASPRWEALRTMIWARLLVATLALPVGVLLRPDASEGAWYVLWWSLLAVGVVSALFWLGTWLRRGMGVQTYLQLGTDLLLVSGIAALTGGRGSQFVLFFALVVIAGGLAGRVTGGVFTGAVAGLAFYALPWVSRWLGAPPSDIGESALPRPLLLFAFLAVVGVLAGVLGERVQRTRDDLERTARELDRVRVDNDVILRHLTTGVLTVSGHGNVAYLNPAAEQVLGIRALEVRGLTLDKALEERLRPLRELVLGTLERREPRARAELLMRTESGRSLPVGVSTNLLMHEGVLHGVVAVFQDLTDVREMERRARRNRTLAELGALSAGIAHELRNGLKPISGSVEVLQRELKLEGENAVLMELIATESNRLNRFVSDLLSYSRERDLVLEPVEINEHLAELCDALLLDPRGSAGLRVRFEAGHAPTLVQVDREQIRQVWLNLAVNAMEAMPSGGELVVRWRNGQPGRVTVEFEDHGAGIAAEDLPRVGQPFFTTKEGGTGLGLPIAHRIVERHGGKLTLESTAGRGTIARVDLPEAAAAAMAQAA
jgi:two-component system sensor histidine kinase PilS (NtrC family)